MKSLLSEFFQSIRDWCLQHPNAALALIGSLVVPFYYGLVVLLVGRDPAPGNIVVQYEPPKGLSPATVRYLWKQGFDERGFTAALISMAAKKYITIEKKDDGYVFRRGNADATVLAEEEKSFYETVSPRGFDFEFSSLNHEKIYAGLRAMKQTLELQMEKKLLRDHRGFLLPGVILSAILLLYLGFVTAARNPFISIFLSAFLLAWALGTVILALYLARLWRSARWLPDQPGADQGKAMDTTLVFGLPNVAVLIGVACVLGWQSRIWMPFLTLDLAVLVPCTYFLLKSPTRAGRAVLDQIEGFRRFLSEVEGDRMARLDADLNSPESFEKLLPYAFAFGVEKAWVKKFSAVISVNSTSGMLTGAAVSSSDWASMDLSSFGVFVSRWFPFELGEIEFSVGPASNS